MATCYLMKASRTKEGRENAMTKYHDIETNEIITEKDLQMEYEEQKKHGYIDPEITFQEYAYNCLTCKGGTLEIIR